ncbi:MAG: NAD(P)H-binding protein [Rhodospirillales bacterium]
MRILLLGATGLIGSAVAARLHGDGHDVVAVVRRRNTVAGSLPAVAVVVADLRQTTESDWVPRLAGIEAVVNCAGVLQDGPRDDTARVHVAGAAALFRACAAAGVRRVVQVSALGADPGAPTAFARTKHAGDAALMALDLDWVVLRPSVVVGAAAYGGSALIRGLAALPVQPGLPGSGRLQVVQLDDVARTVAAMVRAEAPARVVLAVAGPEALTFEQVIAAHRRWLGWPPARTVRLPAWAARVMFALGDAAGALGWRSPVRRTARAELARGSTADPTEWTRLTGIVPQPLGAALASRPASVQDRWFARLYFLKPALVVGLALFWVATGVVALGPGYDRGVALLRDAGLGDLAPAATVIASLADVVVGAAIAVRCTARTGLVAALALTAAYPAAATALAPALWSDPLGPLVKLAPVALAHLAALAILDDR